MEPTQRTEPFGRNAVPVAIALVLGLAAGAGALAVLRPTPRLETTHTVTERPSVSVVTALRDLSRLEGASAHVERVVELTDTQERLFGLVESQDAILLVAAADVVAGVDLATLTDADVVVDSAASRVTITLPRSQILSTAIDEAHTYVHSRSTDLLAARREDLETLARRDAQETLRDAAVEGGVLDRADRNAARTVEALIRSLGFRDVVISRR